MEENWIWMNNGEVQKSGKTFIRMERVGYVLCSKHRTGFGEA
jgi:hypothetical protein